MSLLDGAPARRSVSLSAAGAFGGSWLSQFSASRSSAWRGCRAPALFRWDSRALRRSREHRLPLFLASHYINDQKKFKATMDTITPEMMPAGVTSARLPPERRRPHGVLRVGGSGRRGLHDDSHHPERLRGRHRGRLTPVDDPWGGRVLGVRKICRAALRVYALLIDREVGREVGERLAVDGAREGAHQARQPPGLAARRERLAERRLDREDGGGGRDAGRRPRRRRLRARRQPKPWRRACWTIVCT